MDRRVKKFYMSDPYLKQAIRDGKDVYATFAARLFNCDYEDCLECKDDTVYLKGIYRRKVAKTILCAMYFSTKRKWRKLAFDKISTLETQGKDELPIKFRGEQEC